jgi:HJR/Mrr/RecB family endonuclease
MSRAYYSRSDDHTGFILVILLAGTVWAHKAFMLKVEHYALIFAIACSTAVALVMLYKPLKAIRSWHRKSNLGLESIDNMTGLQFERYIANLLKRRGYTNVQLTEQYDLGVDIIASKDGITWGIQVKRYSGLVKAEAVRQVVTALKFYGCNKAMVITNSSFSRVAIALADSNDCVLVDRQILLKWIDGHRWLTRANPIRGGEHDGPPTTISMTDN